MRLTLLPALLVGCLFLSSCETMPQGSNGLSSLGGENFIGNSLLSLAGSGNQKIAEKTGVSVIQQRQIVGGIASIEKKRQQEAAAERERIRRANLTPEQREAEDNANAQMNGLLLKGIIAVAGSGGGTAGGHDPCYDNPTALACRNDSGISTPAPSQPPTPYASGFGAMMSTDGIH